MQLKGTSRAGGNKSIRIAVDAMGGDYAPREVVYGSILAAQEYGVEVQLVGVPEAIYPELARHPESSGLNITVIPASEVVSMEEKPSRAILKKKDSSIVVTTRQVSEGLADGMVAAGSTGAAAVAAQIGLRRITNVARSAIACVMPTIQNDHPVILLDAGANVECDARELHQFGLMGAILSRGLFNRENPKVALLNIGTEETKGTELLHEAYELFRNDKKINFAGYIEGRDFPMAKVDVVVTDGFTGNCTLKTSEGIARMIVHMLRQELLSTTRGKIGSLIARPSFQSLRARIDYNEYGGALLIGVKGVCVIAHGGSKHTAIKNAIRVAANMVRSDIVNQIENTLARVAAGSRA
jgi:glycerol-3-phosphate acyltransferase PlsX